MKGIAKHLALSISMALAAGCSTIKHGTSDTDLVIKSDVEGIAYFIPKGTYREVAKDKEGFFYESSSVVSKLLSPPAMYIYSKTDSQSLCVQIQSGKRYCYKAEFEKKARVN